MKYHIKKKKIMKQIVSIFFKMERILIREKLYSRFS